MRIKNGIISLAFIATSTSAFATNPVTDFDIKEEPPILRSLLMDDSGKYKFHSRDELGKGMFAYTFIGPSDKPVIVYKTPNNRLVFGDLLNVDGSNQNRFLLETKNLVITDAKKFDALSKEFGFETSSGNSKRVYVFFDANCHYCKKLHEAVESKKNVTINWIPVAYLGSSSSSKIQEAKDTSGGFELMMKGKLKGDAQVTEETKKQLKRNEELMSSFGIGGAPGIVYLEGENIIKKTGLPSAEKIKEIFGE